jgi:peptidoglycan/LPS O-acetylase OafA/YrhL
MINPGNKLGSEGAAATGGGHGSFRPDIEGLRAIAILLVVLYHAGIAGFGGGYIGVDVFFVLSGYLITGLLVREIEQAGTVDLAGFYARRARRLLPALAVVLLFVVLVGAVIYPPFEARQGGFGATAAATAAYASNLYFAKSATDYFGPDRDQNPLLHTWSLSVEEQFYLVWPLFVMFGLGAFGSQGRGQLRRRRLLAWMSVVVALSFALSLYLTRVLPSWAYFASPARAWEFGVGALALLLPRKMLFSSTSFSGWAGLAGIGIASVSFSRTTSFPGFAALLPALATAIALRCFGNNPELGIVRMLSTRPLQEIGRLSYSWYLWHWPILILGSAILQSPTMVERATLIVLSLGCAVLSFHLVEHPIRSNRKLASRHVYSLAMACIIAIVGISVSLAWRQASFWAAEKTDQVRFTRARKDGPAFTCPTEYFVTHVPDCSSGVASSSVSVVLLGDSKAAQWFSALEPISETRGWRLEIMAKDGCPMVDADYVSPALGRVYRECAKWRKDALDKIGHMHPLLTVLSSSEAYLFNDAERRDGILTVVTALAESSQHVLIIRDTPRADFDVPTCLARRVWRPAFVSPTSCEVPRPLDSKVYDFQRQAVRAHNNVELLDFSSSICPEGRVCSVERNGEVIYRDSTHLTASFIKSLQGALSQEIDKVLAGEDRRPLDSAALTAR